MTGETTAVAQELESFARGAQELSAARLARDVASQLARAVHARGRKQRDLAQDLGLSEGAVSQVLNGDGNVRIATLGRYLRALGYEARVELVPVEAAAPALARPARRGRLAAPAPTVTAAPGATIPGTRSTSWTVLDARGALFGLSVKLSPGRLPGLARFTGECQMDPFWFSGKSASGTGPTGVSGIEIENHRTLLQEVG